MKHEKNNIEQIEAYLDGSLSQEEQSLFEKELKSNGELKTQLEVRVKLARLWNDATEYEKVKKNISSTINYPATKTAPLFRTKIVAIAALLITLIGVSFIIINYNKNRINNNRLEFAAIDSTKIDTDKTYELKSDPIKNKASISFIKDSIISQLVIISPNNTEIKLDETINFVWHSDYLDQATLFVTTTDSSDGISFQSEILLSDTSFILEGYVLQRGFYIWFINKKIKYGSFQIK